MKSCSLAGTCGSKVENLHPQQRWSPRSRRWQSCWTTLGISRVTCIECGASTGTNHNRPKKQQSHDDNLCRRPDSINLLGHSLGAAAASQLAAHLSRSCVVSLRVGSDAPRAAGQMHQCRAVGYFCPPHSSALMSLGMLCIGSSLRSHVSSSGTEEMAAVLFGGLLPRWLLRVLVTDGTILACL